MVSGIGNAYCQRCRPSDCTGSGVSREKVVLPPLNMIERICALAIASANRKIYLTLAETLNDRHLRCDIRPMCQAPSIYWNTFKGGFKDSSI
jgi:hypothetical protein